MTENYQPADMPPPVGESQPEPPQAQGTTGVVKDQASDLSQSGLQAGKHVADVARDHASDVAAEARRQGRGILQRAQDQLEEQAAQRQQRLATKLLSLSDDLSSMADASARSGMTADLAHQAASQAHDAGQWLASRSPRQVAGQVQSLAHRRPAAFLVLAAGAGLVAGRLTRGLKDADTGSDGHVNEGRGPSDRAAGDLAPGGSASLWDASPARDEPSSLVTNGQANQLDAS
jgi:hypothetical protein